MGIADRIARYAVGRMSPRKRGKFIEAFNGLIEGTSAEGLRVTTRSLKEMRRFRHDKDPRVLDWMRGFAPGSAFYDIGANVGGLTLAAAAIHGDKLFIVAFEPSYSSFESLARNLAANDMLGHVVPLQVALLDRTGMQPMFYRSLSAGTSLHGIGEAVDQSGEVFDAVARQMIPVFALDDLVDLLRLPPPDYIKLDVDGYEGGVLAGAERLLRSGAPRELLVEVVDHDRSGSRLAAVTTLLEGFGYALTATFRHGDDPGSFVADYLFKR